MLPRLAVLALMVSCVGFSGGTASANVIYSYTGNNFNAFTSPYNADDYVAIHLEFSMALGPNLPLATVYPISFWFSDGQQTIHSPGFNTGLMLISTDSSGDIARWDLTICGNISCQSAIVSHNIPDSIRDGGQLIPQGVQEGRIDNNPGVWTSTASPVPEPSTFAIVGAALGGLMWVRRRRAGRVRHTRSIACDG